MITISTNFFNLISISEYTCNCNLRRFYTAYTQRCVNKRSTRSRVRRIHVDSLFAHDLHLLRWNARGVQSGRIKIEIKTGPVQIVSHSYELLDRYTCMCVCVYWLVYTGQPHSLEKQTDRIISGELLPEID